MDSFIVCWLRGRFHVVGVLFRTLTTMSKLTYDLEADTEEDSMMSALLEETRMSAHTVP